MIKQLILILCLFFIPIVLFAQQEVGDPQPDRIGVDTAQQRLQEVSITKFEDAGFWRSQMPSDQGITQIRRLMGNPIGKEPIPMEVELGIAGEDKYVLGVKVSYFKRGHNAFAVYPRRPLPIEGISKTMSIWVVGRNYNHVLKLIISDYWGQEHILTMGKLNFSGWKNLSVAIPPTISQRDYHYQNRIGIKFEGFIIECDPMETLGTYYIYFDGLRATTDLFAEENRDEDDMIDSW